MSTENALRYAFQRHLARAVELYPAFANHAKLVTFRVMPNMGACSGQARRYEIRVNLTLALQNLDYISNQTIPHEIAHVICNMLGLDRGHGANWKRVARSLGCTGQRCFTEAATGMQVVKARNRKEYQYIASCGSEVWLSDVRHGKVMSGKLKGLFLKATRGSIEAKHFTGKSK